MVQADSMMVAPPGRLWTLCWIASTTATTIMWRTIAEWPTLIAPCGLKLLATEYTFFWFAQILGIWSWTTQWLDLDLDFHCLSHKKILHIMNQVVGTSGIAYQFLCQIRNQTQKLHCWLVLMDFDFACIIACPVQSLWRCPIWKRPLPTPKPITNLPAWWISCFQMIQNF